MADAPWRCSQCGTVNEPVANACRTCGRWPSLFDLESSTLDAPAAAFDDDDLDEYAAQTVEAEYVEPEVYDPAPGAGHHPAESEVELEGDEIASDDAEEAKPLWQRLASFVVPVGIILYILLSALLNNDPG
jgi:hypothetical protein